MNWKLHKSVHSYELSTGRYLTVRSCPLLGAVQCQVLSTVRSCPLSGAVQCQFLSTVRSCTLSGAVRCQELPTVQKYLQSGAVHCQELSTVRNCPLSRVVHCQDPLLSGAVHCQMMFTVRSCVVSWSVPSQEELTVRRRQMREYVNGPELYTVKNGPLWGTGYCQELCVVRNRSCPLSRADCMKAIFGALISWFYVFYTQKKTC